MTLRDCVHCIQLCAFLCSKLGFVAISISLYDFVIREMHSWTPNKHIRNVYIYIICSITRRLDSSSISEVNNVNQNNTLPHPYVCAWLSSLLVQSHVKTKWSEITTPCILPWNLLARRACKSCDITEVAVTASVQARGWLSAFWLETVNTRLKMCCFPESYRRFFLTISCATATSPNNSN